MSLHTDLDIVPDLLEDDSNADRLQLHGVRKEIGNHLGTRENEKKKKDLAIRLPHTRQLKSKKPIKNPPRQAAVFSARRPAATCQQSLRSPTNSPPVSPSPTSAATWRVRTGFHPRNPTPRSRPDGKSPFPPRDRPEIRGGRPGKARRQREKRRRWRPSGGTRPCRRGEIGWGGGGRREQARRGGGEGSASAESLRLPPPPRRGSPFRLDLFALTEQLERKLIKKPFGLTEQRWEAALKYDFSCQK